MRVAIYPRVSTDMQVEEGHSLDAQIDRCRAYCLSQGWDIYDVYTEEGESAKDLDRPQLKRLLEDAERGLFDVVLVYKLDRLTRSVRDLHNLLDKFERFGVKFRSATEIYDTTTAMGKLFITIVAALAEWERGNLAERVRFGMEEVVNKGKWPGGPVPFGLRWDGETMHIHEAEAQILREMRRTYLEEQGLTSTARKMNTLGLLRNGVEWSHQTVYKALDAPLYAGKIRYGTKKKDGKYASWKIEQHVDTIWSDTNYPTIFSWEEYQEHTEIMKRREFQGHSRKREYWFSGILRCARCGNSMTARPYRRLKSNGELSTKNISYMCISRKNGNSCTLPMLRQDVAEKMIMDHIRGISLTYEEISAGAEHDIRHDDDIKRQLAEVERELSVLRERRKKWLYMLANDLMSEKDFRDIKRDEEAKETLLKNHLEELKSQEIGISFELTESVLSLPVYWGGEISDAERKEIMQVVFRSIYIDCKQETGHGVKRGGFLDFYIQDFHFN